VRVVRLARARLESRGVPRRADDEEDVANSVLLSFLEAAQGGRLKQLSHREEMWRIIASFTERKVIDRYRRARARKRDGEQALEQWMSPPGGARPDDDVLAAEALDQFLDLLPEEQRPIAERHLLGYNYREIGEQLGITEHMARRRVERIVAIGKRVFAR
jgi:RNA polymerase sigma factor (sigma-70 family)